MFRLTLLAFVTFFAFQASAQDLIQEEIRVATFNVSMESGNYPHTEANTEVLVQELASGKNSQIQNIAEIIQRTRPDIILLNEFDYISDSEKGVKAFIKHYLKVPQAEDVTGIEYPYFFTAPVNTGEPSPFDLDNNGKASGKGADAWGYGLYPGHYGMLLLSKYPIDTSKIRQFQHFRWADMPNALQPIDPESNTPWYSKDEWQAVRLSSKSMWDVPINVAGKQVNILALHPTPPVFDGPENRNGLRNHDEIRLLADYLSGKSYIYDDQKSTAPFSGQRFVIMGDLNASIHSAETYPGTMQQLLEHPLIDTEKFPTSQGAKNHSPDDQHAAEHTAIWRSRADYVLSSKTGFKIENAAVFWPVNSSPLAYLIADRKSSSDHRLVYLDLKITELE